MIPLKVKGFALDQSTQMPIAILNEERGDRILPVCVGPAEASAIIVKLENIRPARPLTHDLFMTFFLRHGFTLDRVEIYERTMEYTYSSRLRYHRGAKRYCLEVRPSDGIALAVRLGAPIVAEESLFSLTALLPACGMRQ